MRASLALDQFGYAVWWYPADLLYFWLGAEAETWL